MDRTRLSLKFIFPSKILVSLKECISLLKEIDKIEKPIFLNKYVIWKVTHSNVTCSGPSVSSALSLTVTLFSKLIIEEFYDLLLFEAMRMINAHYCLKTIACLLLCACIKLITTYNFAPFRCQEICKLRIPPCNKHLRRN